MERVSKILDANGNPIRIQQLREEQSARIGWVRQEFETHPSRGLTPARLAAILSSAEGGNLAEQADLAEDMEEKDAHIFAELSKRKRAILGLDWEVAAPLNASSAEEKAADQVQEVLRDMDDFADHLFDLADAIAKGYSHMELAWERLGNLLLPRLTHRPARWFQTDPDDRNILLLRSDDGRGEALWPMGWIQHIHKAKSGYVGRAGLARVLAWPYLFKNYSVRDLAEFLEIYGIPARIGTYPSGASDAEKRTLLNAVTSIGHHAAGIMPEGMMLEFREAASGASDPFQAMIAWCEASQSKAILGGTLTTSAENTGLGSNLGDVHNEVRHDLLISDARQIAGTLTRDLIWPLVALNIPGIDIRRAPRFRFLTDEAEDLKARADRDKVLFDMGWRLTPEKVQEVYGDGYEPVPQTGTDKPAMELVAASASVGHACCSAAIDEPDEVDAQVDNLAAQTRPHIDNLIDTIKTELAAASSLDDFQNRLLATYGRLDTDELANVMALAFSAAELAGRFEAQEEAGD
jgi:phage gp29-like protein